jgi:hypothetical protein
MAAQACRRTVDPCGDSVVPAASGVCRGLERGTNIFNTASSRVPGGDSGIPWLPAFLSVCLFYLPKKDSITLKIVAVEAMAVILSSLLPGEGFLSVLGIFHYTLFFAMTVGLIPDLKPGLRALFASTGGFDPASVRVYPATPPPRPAV